MLSFCRRTAPFVLWTFLSLPAFAGPTTRPATQPALPPPLPEVDALISQLTDPHWQIRNRAIERLVALGPTAESQLRTARDSARNVDLRSRVEMALNRIREARRWGASYVTLHLKGVEPRAALEALSTETGVKFDFSGSEGAGGPVTLDADHQHFWNVLRALCAQSKLEIASIDSSGTVMLRNGDELWGTRPASIQGPYMLVAKRMELNRSVDFANPKDATSNYTLVLLAYAEPKVRPIFWTVRGIDQCATDTGRELRQPADDTPETGDLNSEGETSFQFAAPTDGSRKITRLRLTARFTLSQKSQTLHIADALHVKNETRTIDGWRITIKGVSRTEEDRYSAAVIVYRDNHGPDEWNERMGLLDRTQPRLLDKSGKPLEPGGASLNQGPDEWDWNDEFTAVGPDNKPAKIEWEFPLETRHSDVSFEFRDLPLP